MISDILVVLIFVFLIGNIILNYLNSRRLKKLPINSKKASSKILSSKLDILNKRISNLEDKEKKGKQSS